MRILCLHGDGDNARVGLLQMRNLGFGDSDEDDEVVAFDAPWERLLSPQGEGAIVSGPYFSWFQSKEPPSKAEVLKTLKFVAEKMLQLGPFDVIYGFSKGAAIACLMCQRDVIECIKEYNRKGQAVSARLLSKMKNSFSTRSLRSQRIRRDGGASTSSFRRMRSFMSKMVTGKSVKRTLNVNSCILACSSGAVPDLRRTLGLPEKGTMYPNSVHIIGIEDDMRQDGERVALNQTEDDAMISMYIPGGREIPRGLSAAFRNTLRSHVTKSWLFSRNDKAALVRPVASNTATPPASIFEALARQPPDSVAMETELGVEFTYGKICNLIRGECTLAWAESVHVLAYACPRGYVEMLLFLVAGAQKCIAPMAFDLSEASATALMKRTAPDAILLIRGFEPEGICNAAQNLGIRIIYASMNPFTIEVSSKNLSFHSADRADASGLLLCTSGTTSTPKCVPIREDALLINCTSLASLMDLSPSDTCLNAMPLFHVGGIAVHVMPTIISGGKVICMDNYRPSKFANRLEKGDVTWFSFVPTALNSLAAHYETTNTNRVKLKRLRFVRSGAAALSEILEKKLSALFQVPIVQTYGMTESCGPFTQAPSSNVRPGTSGTPIASCIAIVDPATYTPRKWDEEGLIVVGGPTVLQKYKDDASPNSFFILRPEYIMDCPKQFFITGDTGKISKDGHLHVSGRLKEVIKRGGEQISPYEIEAVLNSYPDVKFSLVFAIPSSVFGEEVGAAIVPKATVAKESYEDLNAALKHLCLDLEPSQRPRIIRIIENEDELPMTDSSKYSRVKLAEALGMDMRIDAVPQRIPPPKVDFKALSGLRYILALWVMFNHIGEGPLHFSERLDFPVNSARSFCLHVPSFFALSGFMLSMSMSPPLIRRKKQLRFITSRIIAMYPGYLLSLFFCLVNMIISCNPSTFEPGFFMGALASDRDRGEWCESPPIGTKNYWASLFSTIIVYLFGLQAWPIWPLAWFLAYYTWFSSVYYFCLLLFPFFYKLLYAYRGKPKQLFAMLFALLITNYALIGAFIAAAWPVTNLEGGFRNVSFLNATSFSWTSNSSYYSLTFYMFPPFWFLVVAAGIVAAFL